MADRTQGHNINAGVRCAGIRAPAYAPVGLCVCVMKSVVKSGRLDGQHKRRSAMQTSGQVIEQRIAELKDHMPETYKSIQAKAALIGREAFALVRRGLAGQPCCFWAMERGRVMGTPFAGHPIEADVALAMVQFGCGFAVVWAETPKGGV